MIRPPLPQQKGILTNGSSKCGRLKRTQKAKKQPKKFAPRVTFGNFSLATDPKGSTTREQKCLEFEENGKGEETAKNTAHRALAPTPGLQNDLHEIQKLNTDYLQEIRRAPQTATQNYKRSKRRPSKSKKSKKLKSKSKKKSHKKKKSPKSGIVAK